MTKGYVSKTKGEPHRHRLPFFCPHCDKITGTIDDKYLLIMGFCRECFTMHVEERKLPTIDLSKYAPPGSLFEGMSQEEIGLYFINKIG